jgi:hypothetical protein
MSEQVERAAQEMARQDHIDAGEDPWSVLTEHQRDGWRARARTVLDAAAGHAADDGHTFRLTWQVRSSTKVVGDEHHTDAPGFHCEPTTVVVRAWDLRAALRTAADLPFPVLMNGGGDGD